MKTSKEHLSGIQEHARPVTPLEARTQEIIQGAIETGLKSRAMIPELINQPCAKEAIQVVSKIDFSFNSLEISNTKTCQETAEMITDTLAPSIEMAHSILVSPDFYQPLNQSEFLFTRPFEAHHPPTDERIICGGEKGQQPQERHFMSYDEHNRPTSHVIGKRLTADGLPKLIDFYAWDYAPGSHDYRPLGGLHSRFFCQMYNIAEKYFTETWQEVSLYSLPAHPRLKDPAKDLYVLDKTNKQYERFFLRIIDGKLRVISAGSDIDKTAKKILGIYLPVWHHRPSIEFHMKEDLHTRQEQYGFDVCEQSYGSWIYKHL